MVQQDYDNMQPQTMLHLLIYPTAACYQDLFKSLVFFRPLAELPENSSIEVRVLFGAKIVPHGSGMFW